METESINRWKPTGLLDNVSTENNHMLMVSMSLDWVTAKLIEERDELDERLMQYALPMVVRLYDKDHELFMKISFVILWVKMKKVFDQIDFVEPSGYGYMASEMDKINVDIFFKKLYKELSKL